MSFVCAFAWDYNSLLVFRILQGIGLGGEVPVAAVYISELTRAQHRGRFVLLYELVFPIGLVAAGLIGLWIVPHLGWQWMFYIGALPAILALFLRRCCRNRRAGSRCTAAPAEAEQALSLIERETREVDRRSRCRRCSPWSRRATSAPRCPTCSARPICGGRWSVWVIWFSAYFVNYGLVIWLPTIYRTVFKLPLDVSLRYGLITQAVGLLGALICALTIDYVGRRALVRGCVRRAAVEHRAAGAHAPIRRRSRCSPT